MGHGDLFATENNFCHSDDILQQMLSLYVSEKAESAFPRR